jgi:hypothetical protein
MTFTFTFHLQKNSSLAMPKEVTGVQEQYKVNGKAGKAFGEGGIPKLIAKKVKQSRDRPCRPRWFQEVKVSRFLDNGTGWW